MIARFRQTATGLQCSLVETRRIDGKVLHELVTNLGSVPKSPSVADRIAFWRGFMKHWPSSRTGSMLKRCARS